MRIPVFCLAILAIMVAVGCKARPAPATDSVVALRGTPLDIDVLQNDTDPKSRPLIIGRVWGSVKGDVSINADNTVRYTPRADALGEDAFHYRAKNNRGFGAAGTVHVKIVEPLMGEVLATPARPADAPVKLVETQMAAPDATSTTKPAAAAPPPPGKSAPPPPPPSAVDSVFIQSIAITFFTREDDKDANEPIQVRVRRNEEVLAEQTIGDGEVWEVTSDRTEEIELSRAIPLSDAKSLALEVRKVGAGPGQGGSWTMQIDVQGRLSNGDTATVVPKSLPFRFGGGSSNNRTWRLSAPAR